MKDLPEKNLLEDDVKVGIGGYIALIVAIIFFSGALQNFDNFLAAFDFTNILGSFGRLGEITDDSVGSLASNFRGTGGVGVRDGWLFSLTLAPAVIFALGVVEVVQDYGGLRAAQKLMTPLLKPLLGIPGASGLALIASLQSTDAGAAMTNELHQSGILSTNQLLIFASFQYVAGALITNFLSSGAALFSFIDVPIYLPLLIAFLFKFVAGNLARLYVKFMVKEEVGG